MTDLRFAFRQLLNNPGFTAVAVLTLAPGIGANTTIFTLVNAVVLKPVGGRDPGRLVALYSPSTERPGDYRLHSYPAVKDLDGAKEVFEGVFAYSPTSVGVRDGDLSRRLPALQVSAGYLSVLGHRMFLGRDFRPEDDASGEPVAIVSHAWWRRNGASPGIVGSALSVNGRPFTVVGVAPPNFTGTVPSYPPEVLLPLYSLGGGSDATTDRGRASWFAAGRLRDGMSLATANARLAVLGSRLAEAYPGEDGGFGLEAGALPRMGTSSAPMNDRRTMSALSALLLGMSAMVLLIACLNLANMLLARGAARRREVAIRLALGARRTQVLRQLLAEGGLLALTGGALGLAMAFTSAGWMVSAVNTVAPSPLALDVRPDGRVLAATFGFCVFATLFFALGPAWRLSRPDVAPDMSSQPEAAAARRGVRRFAGRRLLAVAQVALSLALLVGAGLFGRAALRASNLDTGFATERGLYLQFDADLANYPEAVAQDRFHEVLERVRGLPGVESAALAATVPLGHLSMGESVQRAGTPQPAPADAATAADGKAVGAVLNSVSSDYFRTLGVEVVRGREFELRESRAGGFPPVAVINTVLARELWPGEEALGRKLQLPGQRVLEVVGVVAPFRGNATDQLPPPMVFLPSGVDGRQEMILQVRAAAGVDAADLLRRARQQADAVDPNLPVVAAKTLRRHVETNFQVWVVTAGGGLFAALGSVALLLAVLGVYGVTAHGVARRRREIGVRMALGATRAAVLRLVLREGALLTAAGLTAGLLLGAGAASAMGRFLFEVHPFDPLVFALAATLLAGSAMLSCWLPARRAARVDPMVALRSE